MTADQARDWIAGLDILGMRFGLERITALLGALVLSERIGPWGMLGGVALGAAVVLLRPQRDEPATLH